MDGDFCHKIQSGEGRKFPIVLLGKKSTEGTFDRKVGVSGKNIRLLETKLVCENFYAGLGV